MTNYDETKKKNPLAGVLITWRRYPPPISTTTPAVPPFDGEWWCESTYRVVAYT